MVAYAYLGHAVIIMTNADNGGSLIHEVQNAIEEVYDWPIGRKRTIEIIDLDDEDLLPYVGQYKLKGQGLTVTLNLTDSQLSAFTPLGLLRLSPLPNRRFIDLGSELMIEFYGEEEIEGFSVNNGMVLEKVKE